MRITRRKILVVTALVAIIAASVVRMHLDRRTGAMKQAASAEMDERLARTVRRPVGPSRPTHNIILIVADACRGDRIGGYIPERGQKASLTPFLDEWMTGGVEYENAVASSSWTPISMLSMFYGVEGDKVFYGYQQAEGLGGRRSLAEQMKERGYYTMSICANNLFTFPEARRGFDIYDVLMWRPAARHLNAEELSSPAVLKKLEHRIELLERSKSFFLHVQFMDTHYPYFKTYKDMKRVGGTNTTLMSTPGVDTALRMNGTTVAGSDGQKVPTEQGVAMLQDRYNASVISTDRAVQNLLTMLRSRGLLDDTLVIFTADHGEALGDGQEEGRRHAGHAHALTQPELDVPLIIRGPGLSPSRMSAEVSNTRIVNRAVRAFAAGGGEDVARVLEEENSPDNIIRSAYTFRGMPEIAENYSGVAVTSRFTKVVGEYDEAGNLTSRRAYKLDNGRISPQPADQQIADEAALEDTVRPSIFSGLSNAADAQPPALSKEKLEQIKALGYVGH